jgi:hypothetical protein
MRKLIWIVVIATVVAASVWIYAYALRRQAESMVRNAYELSLSKSNPTLADLQQRYGRRLQLDGCDPDGCSYSVTLSNRPLAALHIFRHTRLTSSFGVRNGLVDYNTNSYMVTDGNHFNVTAHVHVDYCKNCDSFSIHPWSNSARSDTNGIVEIGSASSSDEKRRVFSLNTNCVTRMRGCSTVAELLPTVWQQTTDDAIRCRIANHEGFVRLPSDWTWRK